MASSTTIPIAKTNANSVIKLSVMPKSCININVPTNETGTAKTGIKVERQSPKNKKTTIATKTKASNKV